MTITNNRIEMTPSPEAAPTTITNDDGRKKWFYCGNDQVIYGPYASHEMRVWAENGYIGDYVMIRTEEDRHFHRLMDYKKVLNGDCPFKNDISSFEAIQQNLPQPHDMFDYHKRMAKNPYFIPHTSTASFFPQITPHMVSYSNIPVISPQLTAAPVGIINNLTPYGMDYSTIQGGNLDNTINYSPGSSENFEESNNSSGIVIDTSTSTCDAPWNDKNRNKKALIDASTSTDGSKNGDSRSIGTQTVMEVRREDITEIIEKILGVRIQIIN
uniref:GYF domain-containing protein n=1 Tax=Parastrongyloides trichosuri TaxID=131310 RepID=A0A0N4ZDJ4_PARTI